MPSSASPAASIYSLSLHGALPIQAAQHVGPGQPVRVGFALDLVTQADQLPAAEIGSTRLNSSHSQISYAVFCFSCRLDLLSFPTRRSSDPGRRARRAGSASPGRVRFGPGDAGRPASRRRDRKHTSELQSQSNLVCRLLLLLPPRSTLFPYTALFRSRPQSTSGRVSQSGSGSLWTW